MIGLIYKNDQCRYQLEDSSHYWTCGDRMELYSSMLDEFITGRVEHDGDDYYWTDGMAHVPLSEGMTVRIEED